MTSSAFAAPRLYDPAAVFAAVFADEHTAEDLGPWLTCMELNVLLGVLEHYRFHPAADAWRRTHQCPAERRHH